MSNTSRAKLQAASAVAPASSQPAESRKTFKWAAAGGIVGAFGIASCCLLPLILRSLWMKLVLWCATALALAGLGIEYVEPMN